MAEHQISDWRDGLRAELSGQVRRDGVAGHAASIGVSRAALYRWLAGGGGLGDEKLMALAERFGVTVIVKTVFRHSNGEGDYSTHPRSYWENKRAVALREIERCDEELSIASPVAPEHGAWPVP